MKHKRLLGYGGLGLTLIALGVAFVKPISSSNLLIRARADMGNLSVTFNSSSTVESGSIKSGSCVLSSGLQMSGIKAYATIANDSNPTSTEISRFYAGNGSVVFSVDSPASNFRALKSIAFTYISGSYSGNMKIMWSSNNSTWTTISASCGIASQVLPSGAHYLKVVNDGGYARFNSFTLDYSCSDDPEEKELSSISVSGQTSEFTVGDTFSFGGTVTAHYSDSSSANVTNSATFSGYNLSQAGEQTVTISYTEDGVTKTTTYDIEVKEAPVPSKTLSYLLTEKSYVVSGKIGTFLYELTLDFTNKIATARRCPYDSGPSALADFYTQTFNYSANDSTITLSITSVGSPTQTGGSSVALAARLKANGSVSVAITNDEISTLNIGLYNSGGTLQGTISL